MVIVIEVWPSIALRVGRSTPAATARVANVWRRSYKTQCGLIAARRIAALCPLRTQPMGRSECFSDGNTYVPSAVFVRRFIAVQIASVIVTVRRAALVFPNGLKMVRAAK